MALGSATSDILENGRYPGLTWAGIEDTVQQAVKEQVAG
jgi:hypothetical protein